MLEWIETTVQALLDEYRVDNITTIQKVGVLDINALEKKFNDYLEKEQMILTYRELPGTLPNMPVFDKLTSANMYVYALENEKETVKEILNDFISTYNATKIDSLSMILYFTNLTPIGRADNTGAVDYQVWQFGINAVVISSLTNIYDRSIIVSTTDNTFDSSTSEYWDAQSEDNRETYIGALTDLDPIDYPLGYALKVGEVLEPFSYYVVANEGLIGDFNVLNGLVNYNYEKKIIYAEYPKETALAGKKIRYIVPKITMTLLDYNLSPTVDIKGLVYDETYSYKVVVTSGTKAKTFDVFLISATDSISENGFPLLSFVFERS